MTPAPGPLANAGGSRVAAGARGWLGVGGEFDGVRLFAEIADGRVTLHSRNANDVTAAYPELQALAGGPDPRRC